MLRIDEDLAREFPHEPEYRLTLRIAYEKIRDLRWSMGDRDAAFAVYHQALVINEKLVAEEISAADPANASARVDLGNLAFAWYSAATFAIRLARLSPGATSRRRAAALKMLRIGSLPNIAGLGLNRLALDALADSP